MDKCRRCGGELIDISGYFASNILEDNDGNLYISGEEKMYRIEKYRCKECRDIWQINENL